MGVVNDEFSPEAEGISLVSPGKRNLVEEFLLDCILLVEHLLRYAARGSVDGYLPGVGLLHQSRVETNTQTHKKPPLYECVKLLFPQRRRWSLRQVLFYRLVSLSRYAKTTTTAKCACHHDTHSQGHHNNT